MLALEASRLIANDSMCRDVILADQPDMIQAAALLLATGADDVKVLCMDFLAGITSGDVDTQNEIAAYLETVPGVPAISNTQDAQDTGDAASTVDELQGTTYMDIAADLEQRKEASAGRSDAVINVVANTEGAWTILLRAAGAYPPRGIAPGQNSSKLSICSVASTETGRKLFQGDRTFYALVCYIENGTDDSLKRTFNLQLAANAKEPLPQVPADNGSGNLARQSQALAARALIHLIRPIAGDDVTLRTQCLRALTVQLKDGYARKECAHLPLLAKMQGCVAFHDSATRRNLCDLFRLLCEDEMFERRLARKGYFNCVAEICAEIGDAKVDAYTQTAGRAMILKLLQREDAREAAVHGNAIVAFIVALESGDISLQRWCVISLVELAKLLLQRAKVVIQRKSKAAVKRKKLGLSNSVDATTEELSIESMVQVYADLVMPLVRNAGDDAVQGFAVEVLRYLCRTETSAFDRIGLSVFEMVLHLFRSESVHVQIECCRTIDILVQKGFTDISSEHFSKLDLYSQQLSFSGPFTYVDVDAMISIPRAMQSWIGGRLLDADPVDEACTGQAGQLQEVNASRQNPHQLLLAVAAPLLDSFAPEARIAALSLMCSLASKYPQFRIRMHLHDILPSVMRLALSAGNELIFRHKAAAEERDLARKIVCHLLADEVTRRELIQGWKITGILLVAKAYEAVMLGMSEDEANLRSLKPWLAGALANQAVDDPETRRPIAGKALLVLLHFAASTEAEVRHSAVRCIATVLLNKADRDATAFHAETCIKELLRHMHMKNDEKLQRLVDACLLGLLRDAEYTTNTPEKTTTKSLLLLARSGDLREKVWVGETVLALSEHHQEWTTMTTKLTLETLASLIQTDDQSLHVRAAETLQNLATDSRKHELLTNSRGLLLLAALVMSFDPAVQVCGLRALVALTSTPNCQSTILRSGIPQLLASMLDVWYTEVMSAGFQTVFGKDALVKGHAAQAARNSVQQLQLEEAQPQPALDVKRMFSKARGMLFGVPKSTGKITPASPGPETAAPADIANKKALAKASKLRTMKLKSAVGKASKKAFLLGTMTKAAKGSRTREQALVLKLACESLEHLVSSSACDCRRDCIDSGVLQSLARATLITWIFEQNCVHDHPAKRAIASAKGSTCWSLGDIESQGKIDQFPMLYPTLPSSMVLKTLAFGTNHVLALSLCGKVFVHGKNSHGQLGMKGKFSDFTNLEALGDINISSIGCGANFSGAISTEGQLWTWGCNANGQCGLGYLCAKVEAPQPVSVERKALQMSGGASHGVLLDEKGQLWTWGDGALGQLGHGDIRPRLAPTLLSLASEFVSVVSGPNFNLALTRAGKIFSWGDNASGQLGFSKQHNGCMPAQVDLIADELVTNICVGRAHVVAITVLGAAFTWGDNDYGALGRKIPAGSDTFDHRPGLIYLHGVSHRHRVETGQPAVEEPHNLRHQERIIQASCGADHTVLITDSGGGYVVGNGSCGQQGRLDTITNHTPRVLTTMVTTQHIVGVYCRNHGTVIVSLPIRQNLEAGTNLDPHLFAKHSHDEYITDLRVLVKILPGSLFPRNRAERKIATDIVKLVLGAGRIANLHDQLPGFPLPDKEVPLHDSDTDKPRQRLYEDLVDAYAEYSQDCLKLMDDANVYLDNPVEMETSAHIWPTYDQYSVDALGLLAQDFCSDWARQGATERALAGEHVSQKVAENLIGRELEGLIESLPACKPRPATLFFGSVERVLSQLGHSWQANGSSDEETAVYQGYQWRPRAPPNIAVLNLIALPMQRAALYFELLRKAWQLKTQRDELGWIEAAPMSRRPAVAEVKIDLNFSDLEPKFVETFVTDVAAGLDIAPRRVSVVSVVKGSVIVTVVLLPGKSKSEPAAEDLVARLESKSFDASSVLRRGVTTKTIVSVQSVEIADISEELLPKIIEVTKPFSKEKASKFSFRKRKQSKRDKVKQEESSTVESDQKMEYAIGKFVSSSGIAEALQQHAFLNDDKHRGPFGKLILVLGETLGARIVKLAYKRPKRKPGKAKVVVDAKRCSKAKVKAKLLKVVGWLPAAVHWMTIWFFLALPIALLLVFSLSVDAAAGLNTVGLVFGLGAVAMVTDTLFRTRNCSTLSLPGYVAANAAALDFGWPNICAVGALVVEAVQHNALALAVALDWSAELSSALDGWLLWGGRNHAVAVACAASVCTLVLWPMVLHSVLGRITSRRAAVEVLSCTFLPWLLSEPLLLPLLLSLLSAIPCSGAFSSTSRATLDTGCLPNQVIEYVWA
eukprot:SAG11_NODE_89_length_17212_cov_3.812131_3_plen_2266_part_00